jgi:hypothetical protein
MIFHPLAPSFARGRFALGMQFDAVDPSVVYGMEPRVPQFTFDGKFGLGKSWSLEGHVNTLVVANEILVGVGHSIGEAPVRLELALLAGMSLGFLNNFGFEATYFAPQLRPQVTLGFESFDTFFSLQGALMLGYPHTASVGDVTAQLDVPGPLLGVSGLLCVENRIPNHGVWYFGGGVVSARAFYQIWLLFPDAPGFTTYPRLVAGYEF